MIELRDVSVCFKQKEKEIQAVDSVDLKIEKGDVYGIVGYSGAGKSTLVRVMNLLQSRRSHCQSDEFESALSQRIAKRKKGHRYDLSAFQSNGKPNYF